MILMYANIDNDIAVLENHHAHTTFLILRSDRCQLLSGMTVVQQKSVRACMIKAVLATDMSTHFDEMKKLDAVCYHARHGINE
jgi:hypothetical protein